MKWRAGKTYPRCDTDHTKNRPIIGIGVLNVRFRFVNVSPL